MSDLNTLHNRLVWFDIPVADLERANAFYAAVLGIGVHPVEEGGFRFSVLDHERGNGGCLVPHADEVSATQGVLVYLNVDGRIRDAVAKAGALGGKVVEDVKSIGPHGFRAVILDSEGNRIALHSASPDR
jgi:predicted enzyme related to lactoylglutathione lyase